MLASLLESLDHSRVVSTLVTLDEPGPIAARVSRAGVRVLSLGGRGLGVAFARLARLLGKETFDVVNAYGFKATLVSRMLVASLQPSAAFVNGVRGLHITETERVDSPKARFALRVEHVTSRFVDAYDANSLGALDLLAASGIDRTRMHYIPNGIDPRPWRVARGEVRNEIPVIVCVARFVARKRHVDLLEASAMLHSRGHAHRLVLVGYGPTLLQERERAETLGIGQSVTFMGRVEADDVRRVLKEADLFCLVSMWEGMAGTVMEAMAAGLPVVGTMVNGIHDLVDHGVTGSLVAPCDAEALATALAPLLADRPRREALGRAGQERVETHFSLDAMTASKEALYCEIAGRS